MTLAERTAIVRDGGLIESIDSECNQQKQETASPPVGSLLSLYTYAVVHIIYIVIYIYINIYIKRSFSRILSSFFVGWEPFRKRGDVVRITRRLLISHFAVIECARRVFLLRALGSSANESPELIGFDWMRCDATRRVDDGSGRLNLINFHPWQMVMRFL